MPVRLQNTLSMIGKQIHDLRILQLSSLNSDQRSQLTWAIVINSYESVPAIYREFFDARLSNGQTFPYAVLTPAYETFGIRITEKLVCIFDSEVCFLETRENELVTQTYRLDDIHYVETSSMLLDFRVRVSGVTDEGTQTSTIVRCSTATDHLFKPLLNKIRLHAVPSKKLDPSTEVERFDAWVNRNFKFMNLARRSLLSGEQLIHAVLQPEIRMSTIPVLGRTFYKTVSPTHVCILTDQELIMIREDLLHNRRDKYGSICTYVPLNKINSISMIRKNGTVLSVSIQLIDQECFECLFESSFEGQVEELVLRTQECLPGAHQRVGD